MADFARDDAVIIDGIFTLVGTAQDDTFLIDSTFGTPETTGGLLDGSGGGDALTLDNADIPANTTIVGIEQTFLRVGFENNIEASNLDDLGVIQMESAGFAAIRMTDVDGVDVTAELDLSAGDRMGFINDGGASTTLTVTFIGLFTGGSGIDYTGSTGADIITLGEGDDIADGDLGDDILNGGGGNDQLFSGGGTDILRGGAGDDMLFIDNALDDGLVNGGADNDTIIINRTMTNGSLSGGSGTDTLEMNNANLVGVTVTGIEQTVLVNGFESEVDAVNLDDLGVITQEQTSGRLQINNVDGVVATGTIVLEDGQRLGFDTFGAGGTSVTVDLSGGSFAGDSGIDYEGAIGSDLVTLGSGDDTIDGGRGDDRIVAGGGTDEITGGVGADDFAFTAGDGFNTITDFTFGDDRIELFGTPAGFDIFDLAPFASQGVEGVTLNGFGTVIVIEDTTLGEFSASDVLFT